MEGGCSPEPGTQTREPWLPRSLADHSWSPQGQTAVPLSAGPASPFPRGQVSRPVLGRHQAGEVMPGRMSSAHTHNTPLRAIPQTLRTEMTQGPQDSDQTPAQTILRPACPNHLPLSLAGTPAGLSHTTGQPLLRQPFEDGGARCVHSALPCQHH